MVINKSVTLVWLGVSLFLASVFTPTSKAQGQLMCGLADYKASPGMTAEVTGSALIVTWDGKKDDTIRLRLVIDNGVPTVADLALKHDGGSWNSIASNVTPEFRVVSGFRRLDQEAYPALKLSMGEVTQAVLDRFKWGAFWDAPLRVPGDETAHGTSTPPPDGIPGTNQPGLPRKPQEIKRATATYQAEGCDVKTNGHRLEILFPGVQMGIFTGSLQYTIYEGTDLIRLELIAKTEEQSVAYKYDAGWKGLKLQPKSKIVWRDTSNYWQDYDFTNPANGEPATVVAANRLMAVQAPAGSIVTFPPPHDFFWAREISVSLGYNWFRKDNDETFSFGIRQAEDEIDPAYAGRGPEDRRQNFALYNARPGTWQRMPIYFLVDDGTGEQAIEEALAFTRKDHYQEIPGYWIMARHFHTSPVPRLLGMNNQHGSLGDVLPDFELARQTGINIFGPVGGGGVLPSGNMRIGPRPAATLDSTRASSNVTSDAVRLEGQAMYYDMARLQSRNKFLVMPNEEIFTLPKDGGMGGHNDVLLSHPVFWTNGRAPDQPFVEEKSKYGKVYHIGNPADLIEMTHRENMLIFMPHPDTKGSAGYPDAFREREYFIDANYRGVGFRWAMDLDRSEKRMSDYRCMPLFDEMNNWVADLPTPPKYEDAITETYELGPGDDFYANDPVTYVKVEGQPGIDNWRPIIDAMMKGHFFVTTGEVLIPNYALQGTGVQRMIIADLEWTFPLEYAEVVWGDGQKTDRQIISLTDQPAFGKHHFEIPFNTSGKKWVRFAVWDSGGNGAFVQPIKLPSAKQPITRNGMQ